MTGIGMNWSMHDGSVDIASMLEGLPGIVGSAA
jgi:hypothetical protein